MTAPDRDRGSAAARRVGRRPVLRGLVLAPVLVACAVAPPPARPAVGNPRLRTTWTGRGDGPLPATGDEGIALRAVHLDGTPAAASVTGGALVGNLPDARGAVYVMQDLPQRLTTIGARFGFTPGGPTGSLCLAAWTGAPASDTNCHLVVTPARWMFGVVRANTLVNLADGPLTLPQDGTPVTASVDLDGGPTAAVHLPDGQTRSITDARIGAIRGRIACWEFYRDAPGDADARLYETWAA